MTPLRLVLLVPIFALASCATAAGNDALRADVDALRQKQQVDLENLQKSLRADLDSLRVELATLRESQEKLEERVDNLKAAAPRPAAPGGPDRSAVYAFPVGDSPVRGAKDAWVTIVEVSDFQCPFCSRVQVTLGELLDKYGNDVRLVFKHNPLPFHPRALPAAIAAECAHEQGQFWPVHDRLFDNQRELEDQQIESYVRQVKLDYKKWKSCYEQNEPADRITKDQQLAATLGARGTPAFFINGRFLSGAQPAAAFEELIDEELKKAKRSGLDRANYYDKAVLAKGRTSM
jgi:protein-disulfide isomerase